MRPHFHVAGFPVRVHLLFFAITFASGWGLLQSPARLALWMGVVFVSVLLHELGHALAFRRYGCPASIELHGMGGTTTGHNVERLTHGQSAWVSFAGPGMGFLLGGLVWALSRYTPLGQQGGLVAETVRDLIWVNVGWGLFNLLPLQPLDGGHVLASVVRARSGYRYEKVLLGIGIVTAVGLIVLAVQWRMPWMGLLALMFGVMNVEQLLRLPTHVHFERSAALPSRRIRVSARYEPEEAGAVPVERLMRELRSEQPEVKPEARRALTAVPEPEEPEGPHDPAMVGEMLLASGLAAMAVRPLQSAFSESPSPRTGQALVQALLELKRFTELEALLSGPQASHLSNETLAIIYARAAAAGQTSLASRAGALRQGQGGKR
ncbi:M50 family metallopeptidase [Pyxidicoccus parkwayensis]|uniref:M50 family metallopeptidase n=1 Tax=Pyxidicoccus parkwayensis TaxID=2813578 RepID=A0ABX7P3W0_9BACT|nr:M50 family metallopeptidase [Pyxidicoccus parkwaysis]QSQ25131.1 M50 family metallopeptidase [Pyxidicoccus parkwaysis]